ncbi:VOC family protein [Intrasporangium sp.]|uniref:VOC family protein n=1 Tax=Intrasporangium sp. TaxID=1925024 RepID=UPI00293B360A|nr:VOC family protein [Intrasporangium sp.]MDV3220225.1 VOC family protein [Intrasporangium sp.]
MALVISHTTVNALDAHAQSVWWADLLGYHEDADDPNEPGHDVCMILSPDESHRILFIEVPDAKAIRNRIHFDLRPTDRSRDEEVERVAGLGAAVVEDRRTGDGRGWVVMVDPEGNEFCILRSDEERRAAGDL